MTSMAMFAFVYIKKHLSIGGWANVFDIQLPSTQANMVNDEERYELSS